MDYLLPFPQDVLVSHDTLAPASQESTLLGLTQSGALGNSPGVFELLTTFPPNWLPLTGFLDTQLFEIAKHNAQALVFGGRGEVMTGDVIVSTGHRHDTVQSWLSWKQIATFLFQNNGASSIGSSPDECIDALLITSSSTVTYAILHLHLLPIEAASITPRLRISHAASGGDGITVGLGIFRLDGSTPTVVSEDNFIATTTVRNRAWVYLSPCILNQVEADYSGRIPLLVYVNASVDGSGSNVALHEIAFGVTTP